MFHFRFLNQALNGCKCGSGFACDIHSSLRNHRSPTRKLQRPARRWTGQCWACLTNCEQPPRYWTQLHYPGCSQIRSTELPQAWGYGRLSCPRTHLSLSRSRRVRRRKVRSNIRCRPRWEVSGRLDQFSSGIYLRTDQCWAGCYARPAIRCSFS